MFYSKEAAERFEHSLSQVTEIKAYTHPLINFSDVIKAHYCLADYFLDQSAGEAETMSVGIRSNHLLGSALGRQTVGFNGISKYTDPIDICSTLFYGLVTDHPFVDGNKRTALLILLYQLQLYGLYPKAKPSAFEKLVVSVAERSLARKYKKVYRTLKGESEVDAEVLTVSHILKKLTQTTDRSPRLNVTAMEFCEGLKPLGVEFTLEGAKIRFRFEEKNAAQPRTQCCKMKFYGWTRPIEATAARKVFAALGLTEEHPFYQSVFSGDGDPFYKLIRNFERPLRRLKDE